MQPRFPEQDTESCGFRTFALAQTHSSAPAAAIECPVTAIAMAVGVVPMDGRQICLQ